MIDSFHFCQYRNKTQTISIFADSITPRWLTTMIVLDYSTIAGI
jgi:hypothetical protein